MRRQRPSKDPYESFKEDLLHKRGAPEEPPASESSEEEEEEEALGEDLEASGSSWDPMEDEEEADELDEDMSESNMEGSVKNQDMSAANPQEAPENLETQRRLANNRKFPFFRAIMLDTLIERRLRSPGDPWQFLRQGSAPPSVHRRLPQLRS